jgi:hypothetical protein
MRRHRVHAPPFSRSTRPPHSSQSVARIESRKNPNFAIDGSVLTVGVQDGSVTIVRRYVQLDRVKDGVAFG